MNKVMLVGRLTADPTIRTAGDSKVANFSVAINRPGKDDKADFPRVVAFGKTAENIEKYLKKGSLVSVDGSIQTGSYKDKDGKTVYTTEVAANRVEFLDKKGSAPADAPAPEADDDSEDEIAF